MQWIDCPTEFLFVENLVLFSMESNYSCKLIGYRSIMHRAHAIPLIHFPSSLDIAPACNMGILEIDVKTLSSQLLLSCL